MDAIIKAVTRAELDIKIASVVLNMQTLMVI